MIEKLRRWMGLAADRDSIDAAYNQGAMDAVKAIRDELVGWPTHSFSDLVMALWIGRHQFSLHVQASEPVSVIQRNVPDYVRRFTSGWRR